jgi:hypothetical protein
MRRSKSKGLKQTRQPFQGLAVVVGTPGQFVRLTRLGTFPSVSVSNTKTWLNCLTPQLLHFPGLLAAFEKHILNVMMGTSNGLAKSQPNARSPGRPVEMAHALTRSLRMPGWG